MRAICVLLAMVAVVPRAAHSQALLVLLFGDKLSTERFQLGINADLAWSNLTSVESKNRFSWGFGAYGEVKLSDRFRLQPEITVKTPAGAKQIAPGTVGNPFVPVGEPTIDAAIANGTVTRSTSYLTVPVYLKYMLGPVGLGAGGQVGLLLGANDELISTVDAGDLRLVQGVKDSLQNFDAGLVFSIDYSLKPDLVLRSMKINVKYYLGLTNTVSSNSGSAIRNSILFVGLDIPVGGPKDVDDGQQ
jgi:hypothetical protein